jgi:hypothetical protein
MRITTFCIYGVYSKCEKSNIHFLVSETMSRKSRVTESAQEIIDSIPYNCG